MPIKDLIDQVKKTSADAFESVRQHVNGLRGSPANPEANPNVGPGRPSPEAQAYRAQPKGPFPAEPVPPTGGGPSLMQRGLRGLGRAAVVPAAAYGGVYAAVDAAQNGNSDWDYDTGNKLFQPALDIRKGIATGVGNIKGALGFENDAAQVNKEQDTQYHDAGPIRAAGVGAVRRVAEAFGFDPSGRLAQQPVKPAAVPLAGDPPAPASSDLIPTIRGEAVTPGQMMAGNVRGVQADIHNPASGYGAFQRTTRGDVGPATKVGARTGEVQPGGSNAAGLRLALPEAKNLAGHMVNLAALGAQAHAASIKESGAAAETGLGIRAALAGTQIKRTNQEITAGANTALDKTVNDHIAGLLADKDDQYGLGGTRKTGVAGIGGESADQYKDRLGQQASETRNRIASTLANRKDGKNLEDLSDTETQQLLLLDRIRRKVDNGRGDKVQSLRDFFGNKRFDSNDLYSYAPVAKLPSAIPGQGSFHFQLANGNTVTAVRAKGGEWNFTTPNGPVDSDVAEFFTKQIELQKKGK